MSRRPFIIVDERVRANLIEAIKALPIGYVAVLQEPTRNLVQNARLWAMLTEISRQADLNGRRFSAEQWKCIFMKELGHEVDFLPTLDGASFFPTGFKSSQLSKREMADLITSIQAFGDLNGVRFNDDIARAA